MGKNQPATEYLTDSVRQHLRDISQYPLLTSDEVVENGRYYQLGVVAADTLAGITDPLHEAELSNDEFVEQALVSKVGHVAVSRGEGAKEKLTVSNLRLTVSIAKRYQNNGLPLLDMIQEGHIGLQTAVEKFDPEKGFKFSTYATQWVTQAITRAISNQGSTIRTPSYMHANLIALRRAEREFKDELGQVDDAAVCESLEIDPYKLESWRLYDRQSRPTSLNLTVGDEGSAELGDMVADDKSDVDFRESEQQFIFEELWERIKKDVLDEREQDIIIHRFGLFGVEPLNLEEVGKRYDLTHARIVQIEKRALNKIRVANFGFSVPDYVS